MNQFYKQAFCALGLSCIAFSTLAQDAASDATPVPAKWQQYDFSFAYMGFSTYYSCSGLEDRLKQILQNLGAKRDVQVGASGCVEPTHVGKMLNAHIKVNMPVEVTDSTPVADAERLVAHRSSVTLNTRVDGYVSSGDCELMEQVRDRLLPVLKLHAMEDNLHCVPGQATVSNQTLKVAVLLPEQAAPTHR